MEDIDEMQEWVDEDWAQDPLNGRDIRNILSSAVALAKSGNSSDFIECPFRPMLTFCV